MPKPRRRRRFFALEGRFEVGDSGPLEGIADPVESSSSAGEEHVSARLTDAEPPGSAELSRAAESSPDESLPPAFRLNREPRSRPPQRSSLIPTAWLFSLLCLGLGAIAGYLSAKSGAKPLAVSEPDGLQKEVSLPTLTDEKELDGAYEARHARNFEQAEQLFTNLTRRHPAWEPIKVELGRTLFYANKASDGIAALQAAVEKGWKPAEANFLLGVIYKARKSYSESERCFAKSVAIDPTAPEYYFFWGECLREEGKLLDATAKFRSALLRNQYETATGLYRAKLWLCAIEANQPGADDVDAQIDAALAQAWPPMEALVAAAARNMKTDNFGAAAAHLSQARQRADETVFRYIINDPMFASGRARPELAGFFSSVRPSPEGTAGSTDTLPAASTESVQRP